MRLLYVSRIDSGLTTHPRGAFTNQLYSWIRCAIPVLQGGTARGTGRGEILTYGKSRSALVVLASKPRVSVSTAAAYGRFTNKSVATDKPSIHGPTTPKQ